MKITEPKTPYVRYNAELDEVEGGACPQPTWVPAIPAHVAGLILYRNSRIRLGKSVCSFTTARIPIAYRALVPAPSVLLHRKAARAFEQR